MPATGHLAKISQRKYGYRPDDRVSGMYDLFWELSQFLNPKIHFESDKCSYYPSIVKSFFPKSTHSRFKGEKGSVAGQEDLKKSSFDQIFSINQLFAMLRANINRLIRRTWCTSKNISALEDHLSIYILFHNQELTLNPA